MQIGDIAIQNPWWARKEAIQEDAKIRQYEAGKYKWRPRILNYIDLGRDVVYSIRGPRQIGKTTMLKLQIRELLEKGHPPQNIMYYACDMVRESRELYDIMATYVKWAETAGKGRIILMLDEISSVRDWGVAIKKFIDDFQNAGKVLVLTGSHSIDIEKNTERFPGRGGEREGISTHKILLPMKFAEYVELKNPALCQNIKAQKLDEKEVRGKEFMSLLSGIEPDTLKTLLPLQPELDRLLEEYLLDGGIMFAVNQLAEKGEIPQQTYELYIRQLMGDIHRIGRDEMTAKQVLSAVLGRVGSRASWLGMAKEAGIPSNVTIEQYAGILQGMFILDVFHLVDEKMQPKYRSEKKIHVPNPFMFHALRSWVQNPAGDPFNAARQFLLGPENRSRVIEGLVGDHLARAAYNLKPNDLYSPSSAVFYFRLAKGREIDYVLPVDGRACFVDVAYKSSLASEDYLALKKMRRGGCLVSKGTYAYNPDYRIVTIPVSLFLMYV